MKSTVKVMQTLRARLLVSMVLLITASLALMTALNSMMNTKALDEQATDYSRQMLEQIQINVNSIVSKAQNIMQYLSEDQSVLAYLRLDNFYDENRIELETKSRDAMRVYVKNNKELIGGILVLNRHGLYASGELFRTSRNSLTKEKWYQQAVESPGKNILFSKPIGRNIQNYQNYSAMDVVSMVRAVVEPDTHEVLGVICMDLKLSNIEEYIRGITLGKNGYVFLMDEMGEIVYAPVNETAYRIRYDWLREEKTSLYHIGNAHYQLMSIFSPLTNWHIVAVFNSDEVLKPVERLREYMILIGLVIIAMTTIASLFFSSSFSKPISSLKMLMGKAEKGDLTVHFDSRSDYGEIAELGGSFNHMIDQLHHLMELVVEEQKLKREADIKTLQAQIKPHFLYNTLDTIRWMAEEHGVKNISLLVGALTKLFRISLSRGHEIIGLNQELEHVRSYLYIQKVRYEHKLNYEILCEDRFFCCKVNKLILQPLVENAIYHGIKQKRGEGHIKVEVSQRDQDLVLSVWDDGAGMPLEQCESLNRALQVDTSQKAYSHGYGIFNVNDRIRLAYGPKYGLHYSLNESGGVTVEAVLPFTNPSIAYMERTIKEGEAYVEDFDCG